MLFEIWLGRSCFSYGHPDLPTEVLDALADIGAISHRLPIAEVVERAMVCDPRVAAQAIGDREPYVKIADFIADLRRILQTMPCSRLETPGQ
jgi:hypothetical protein